MKKITFLLFTITSMTYGQGITEDFEGGMVFPTASGWTQVDIAGDGDLWAIETGGNAQYYNYPGESNDYFYSDAGCSGNYLHFDSDGFGNNGTAEEAAIVSPVFSCAAFTQVTISFNHLFTEGFGGFGFVEVSTDGNTWTTIATYGTALEFGFVSIDATTELAGESSAQVRFRWVGDYSWGWAVDNIIVQDPLLSVDDNQIKLFNVYPNPVKDVINIDTNLTIDSITIFNQLGQNVMQLKSGDILNNEVNLSKLSNGLYFMNISSEDKSQTIKIIKE